MDSPITVCHANLRKIQHLLFLSSNRMKNNGTGNPNRYSLAVLGFLKIRCWRCEICVITFWLSPISMLRLRPSVLLQSLLVHTQDSQYSQCRFKLKSWFPFSSAQVQAQTSILQKMRYPPPGSANLDGKNGIVQQLNIVASFRDLLSLAAGDSMA